MLYYWPDRYFVAIDRFEIAGRGTVFSGPAPFAFDRDNKDDMDKFLKHRWVISHDSIEGSHPKFWAVRAVECYAMPHIREGSPIGLAVKELPEC
jgi:hypothetical protein